MPGEASLRKELGAARPDLAGATADAAKREAMARLGDIEPRYTIARKARQPVMRQPLCKAAVTDLQIADVT